STLSSTARPTSTGSSAIVGVRASVGYTYNTFFMRVLGSWAQTVHVGTTSRAVLSPMASTYAPSGGPFIVCGGGTGQNGAVEWDSPGQEPTGANKNSQRLLINSGGSTAVDYANYTNKFFVVHWSQLGQNNGDCGIDKKNQSAGNTTTNTFKGVAIPSGSTVG